MFTVAFRVRGAETMQQITLQIPDELADALRIDQARLPELVLLGLAQLKIQEALLLYKRGLVSFGRAAELAGVSRRELIRHARANGIGPRWDEQMLREELGE
jgi:predicted HTH domain antitoxin